MSGHPTRGWGRFQDLVFSDYCRYRPGSDASWLRVLSRCPTLPGMLASLLLRAQQCLFDSGHKRLSDSLRTVINVTVGMDTMAPLHIGRGFMLAHPVGCVFGAGVRIGDNVTFAGGVTCAMQNAAATDTQQEVATIGDGAILGAHAVLVGGVTIGKHAMVGANSVVLSDVPECAVVLGVPARRLSTREPASFD